MPHKDPAAKIAYMREWRKRNKDKVNQKHREDYQKHLEARRATRKRYGSTALGVYSKYKAGAKHRGKHFDLTMEEFCELYGRKCHYCGEKEAKGVDRVDNDKGYTKENSVPCCTWCNYAKGDTSLELMLEKVKAIAARHLNMVEKK